MKLSHDLCRELLLNMEEKLTYDGIAGSQTSGGFSKEDVQVLAPKADLISIYYHIEKLREAGFIHALDARHSGAPYMWIPRSLTYAGHQFLDDIRDESRWRKIKDAVGAMSLETMKALMPQILAKIAGL